MAKNAFTDNEIQVSLKYIEKLDGNSIGKRLSLSEENSTLNKLLIGVNVLTRIYNAHSTVSRLAASMRRNANLAVRRASSASSVSNWASIGFALIDFFSTPVLYMSAWLNNEKIPITRSKNARWFFSTVLLTLSIIAVKIPVMAPAIAITCAAMALISSYVSARIFFVNKHKNKKDIVEMEQQLSENKTAILQLKGQLLEKAGNLNELSSSDNSGKLSEVRKELEDGIIAIFLKLEERKIVQLKVDALHKKQQKSATKAIDKVLSVAFAAIALIGVSVSLFFPIAGAAILSGVVVSSLAYTLGRVVIEPMVVIYSNRMRSPVKEKVPEEWSDSSENTLKKTSTRTMLNGLLTQNKAPNRQSAPAVLETPTMIESSSPLLEDGPPSPLRLSS